MMMTLARRASDELATARREGAWHYTQACAAPAARKSVRHQSALAHRRRTALRGRRWEWNVVFSILMCLMERQVARPASRGVARELSSIALLSVLPLTDETRRMLDDSAIALAASRRHRRQHRARRRCGRVAVLRASRASILRAGIDVLKKSRAR